MCIYGSVFLAWFCKSYWLTCMETWVETGALFVNCNSFYSDSVAHHINHWFAWPWLCSYASVHVLKDAVGAHLASWFDLSTFLRGIDQMKCSCDCSQSTGRPTSSLKRRQSLWPNTALRWRSSSRRNSRAIPNLISCTSRTSCPSTTNTWWRWSSQGNTSHRRRNKMTKVRQSCDVLGQYVCLSYRKGFYQIWILERLGW